jgi:hypothetical protein
MFRKGSVKGVYGMGRKPLPLLPERKIHKKAWRLGHAFNFLQKGGCFKAKVYRCVLKKR